MKGKKKPKYYGTVTPYPNFSASSDASVLQNAIESKGVLAYLSSDFFAILNWMQFKCFLCIYKFVSSHYIISFKTRSGITFSLTGVDEDVIISVLAKRNNEQRQKIKAVYEAKTGEVSSV